ncbi:MAG: DUF992 domain-containing protein [Nevskia sp.]|nr:DUF992 domain-containing protein [Nevskia sp.]
MKMNHGLIAAVALLAAGAVTATPAFADEAGVAAGILTCHESSGWGFVFGSSRDIRCVYSATPRGSDRYSGTINKFGVDIGYLKSAVLVWAVLAPTSNVAPGDLAGSYAGLAASGTVGVGVGANALVGGSGNHIVLQPVSIEGQTGLNVAAGVASLELKVRKPRQ